MESVTLRLFESVIRRIVLNAFRHHGIGHTDTEDDVEGDNECSTPSGIMESVTQTVIYDVCHKPECSTPSGIMESVTRMAT